MAPRLGTLLAIDSGYPRCAVASVLHGNIVWLDTYDPVASGGGIGGRACHSFDRVVVEIPHMRPDTPDGNDLIRIAVAGARLAERAVKGDGEVTEYRPTEWKGNTPKPAHHRRTLWPALTAAERILLGGPKTFAAIDAACMRGAKDRWRKPGATYYRARELPTVNGVRVTHDMLDAAALALFALGRIGRG